MSLYSTERLSALRMIVTGGGTGGHTYPALTTVTTLRARLEAAGATAPNLLWVGIAGGLEADVAGRNNVPFRAITTGKLRRSLSPRDLVRNLADAFRIPLGILQAVATVARTRPAVVFSTGGFVSVPIGLAARLFRVPYLLHEQTLAIGLANRILAHAATRILLSHEASLDHLPARARRRAVVTGNPIRPAVLNGSPARGLAAFHLDPAVPLVLVTGGAIGAQQINRMLAGALPDLLPHCQIVHQCGSHGLAEMQQVAGTLPPHLADRYRVRTRHRTPRIHPSRRRVPARRPGPRRPRRVSRPPPPADAGPATPRAGCGRATRPRTPRCRARPAGRCGTGRRRRPG
jgi:UDP-N-acetylglucosamine--N-acetylmuramyl-(pentapeptide) pyrophosphoryl-undecaprenol N-acetylglucosamine transferase